MSITATNTLSDAADDSVSDTSSSRDFDHLSEPSTRYCSRTLVGKCQVKIVFSNYALQLGE